MIATAAGIKSGRLKKAWTANDFLPPSMRVECNAPVAMGKISDLQIFLPESERQRLRERA